MPSLSNSNAGQMSNITWGQAKNEVAQVVGGQNDPETLLSAKAQIKAVLEDWNSRRNWQFLQVQADDIPIVNGTSTYDLPTTFKKPYAALLSVYGRPLSYITRRQYNLSRPWSQASPTVPIGYMLYNVVSTGKIELIPSNSLNDILKVWYYRLMIEEDSDDAFLDVLGRYANYVLDGARARLLGLKGPVEKLSFWMQQSEAGYLKAVADDETIPDEDTGFAPQRSFYGTPGDNSFAWVDSYWSW